MAVAKQTRQGVFSKMGVQTSFTSRLTFFLTSCRSIDSFDFMPLGKHKGEKERSTYQIKTTKCRRHARPFQAVRGDCCKSSWPTLCAQKTLPAFIQLLHVMPLENLETSRWLCQLYQNQQTFFCQAKKLKSQQRLHQDTRRKKMAAQT